MAQTRKKRRRKRRGTQGGSIDAGGRSRRPRSREEAKARARSRGTNRAPKADLPPTWRGAFVRGIFAAVIFGLLLIVLFRKPVGPSILFGAFMLAFYVPAGYFIDMALWRRRERARIRARGE